MKKVTYRGRQYTVGGLYEFSDICEEWYVRRLRGISETSTAPFIDEQCADWLFIRELQNPVIGTIEDAPIELEDGAVYQFDYTDGATGCTHNIYGHYDSSINLLRAGIECYEAAKCTNITKLVPEEK